MKKKKTFRKRRRNSTTEDQESRGHGGEGRGFHGSCGGIKEERGGKR